MNRILIWIVLYVSAIWVPATVLGDEPKPCKGTKEWYRGECRYPEEIQKLKRAAKKKKKPRKASCKGFEDCLVQARDCHFGIGRKKNRRQAAQYIEAACRKVNKGRCKKASALEVCCRGAVMGTDGYRDMDFGTLLCEEACHEQDVGGACVVLGWLRTSLGRLDDGYKLFARACELKSALGCNNQGAMKRFGWGTEKELVMARILFDKACELGYNPGCKYEDLAQ